MGVSKSLFHDDSMLRTVIREQVVGLSGPRALLMQAAHPVAFAGFFAHTGALDEPYERLSRTARVLDLVAFSRGGEAFGDPASDPAAGAGHERRISVEGRHGWAHCMMSNARAPRGPAS